MSDQDDDYEVGYGKPPTATRFKKGRSGNPKGRPKGAKGIKASLARELESKIVIREGGREQKVSKAEAAAKRLVTKALGGDLGALKLLAMFDADLKDQAEREAGAAVSPDTMDQTDEAILQHFAKLLSANASGQTTLDECAGPADPAQEEPET